MPPIILHDDGERLGLTKTNLQKNQKHFNRQVYPIYFTENIFIKVPLPLLSVIFNNKEYETPKYLISLICF